MTSREVSVGILEIETAPTVVMIDLTHLRLRRMSLIGKRSFANPTKDFGTKRTSSERCGRSAFYLEKRTSLGAVGIALCGDRRDRVQSHAGKRRNDEIPRRDRPTLRIDSRKSRGRPRRGAETALAACLSRSLDSGLRRRVPGHYDRLCRCHAFGAVVAQYRCTQAGGRSVTLKEISWASRPHSPGSRTCSRRKQSLRARPVCTENLIRID